MLWLLPAFFLFTLFLLTRYGESWRPQNFYEDCFLQAFPMVLDEVESTAYLTAEDQVRSCYTLRALNRFSGFLGLATMEPVSADRVVRKYRVQSLPLLREIVHFLIPG